MVLAGNLLKKVKRRANTQNQSTPPCNFLSIITSVTINTSTPPLHSHCFTTGTLPAFILLAKASFSSFLSLFFFHSFFFVIKGQLDLWSDYWRRIHQTKYTCDNSFLFQQTHNSMMDKVVTLIYKVAGRELLGRSMLENCCSNNIHKKK